MAPSVQSLDAAARAEIARAEMAAEASRLVGLRDRMIETIVATLQNAYLIGDRYRRLSECITTTLLGTCWNC